MKTVFCTHKSSPFPFKFNVFEYFFCMYISVAYVYSACESEKVALPILKLK